MQNDLFGQPPEQQPRRFPVSTIGTVRHRKCTMEERSILTSALIKFLRLGDERQCIDIFWRMKVVGVPDSYIIHRLCAFAWEDSDDDRALLFATALKTTGADDIDNAMTRTILALCRSRKFWDTPQGAHDETMRLGIQADVLDRAKKGKLIIDDFPAWVRDHYSVQGRSLKKAGVTIEERYSGIIEGGNNLRAETLVYGQPSPEQPSLFDSVVVQESAKQYLSVDEYLEQNHLTVDDIRREIMASQSL